MNRRMCGDLCQDVADALITVTEYVCHFRGRCGLLDPSPQRVQLLGSLLTKDILVERMLEGKSLDGRTSYRSRRVSNFAVTSSGVKFDVDALIPLVLHAGGKQLRVERYKAMFLLGLFSNFWAEQCVS